jgi:hypothetical protein
MTQPKNTDTSTRRKISEMISEMAAGFLGVGDTIEEFPDDHRQIVSAKVVMAGNDYRIEVVSATLQ